MDGRLKRSTISGILWSSLQKFGIMFLSFIANIILARLLTPYDFGCIGMLSIFMMVATSLIDGGLGAAIIQKKNPSQEDYSTVFYLNIILSIIMYALVYVCAPFISEFYHIPELRNVLRVLGCVLIINAISAIQVSRFRKLLEFRKLSIIYLLSILISSICSIIAAFLGYGVWSLVILQIVNSVISTILLCIYGRWSPSFVFAKNSVKQLFGFGSFLMMSNLINNICNNIQGLIIGRLFSPAIMGYYSQAKKLEEIPSTSISQIIDSVSYPILSECQNDKEQLIAILRKFISIISFITVPLMLLLIVIGKPLIVLIFSSKWIPSVPYFQILCIAGLAICMQSVNYNVIAAIGRSKILFKWTIIKRSIGIAVIMIGALFGIYGIIIGTTLSSWILYLCNAYLVQKILGYTIVKQIKDISPTYGISMFSMVVSYILCFVIEESVALYICQVLIFVAIYILLSYLTNSKSLNYIKHIRG